MKHALTPINEFVIWNNCNNNCFFCQQTKKYKLSKKEKCYALQCLIKKIEHLGQLSNILIVGGEIFDQTDNDILNLLYQIYMSISIKMKRKDIKYLYINTNLLYKNLQFLFSVLKIFNDNNQLDCVKFTTSYDIYGRFNTHFSNKIFKDNIKNLKQKYPNLNIVMNVILTKQACHSIIMNIDKVLMNIVEYGYINFIPYLYVNDNIMTVDRNELYDALRIIEMYQPGYIEKNIKNLDLPQKKNVFYYQNGEFINATAKYNSCGHCLNFKMYSSNDSCYICDIKQLFNIV